MSTGGTTVKGSGSRSTRPDAGQGSADLPSRPFGSRDTSRSVKGTRPQSQRRLSGRTTTLAHQPDAHSRSRRSSALRQSPCARLRHASLVPRQGRRRALDPVRGGSVPREKASGDPDRRKGRLSASLICRALGWRHLKNQSPHGLIHTGSGGAATLQSFARGRNLGMLLAPAATISLYPATVKSSLGLFPLSTGA